MTKRSVFFIVLVILFWFSSVTRAQILCNTPPPSAEMDPLFYQSLTDSVKDQKIRVAVFPFQDGSQLPPDPILEKAFGIALTDLLQNAGKIGVYSPLSVAGVVTTQGLTPANFFSSDKIAAAAAALGATHAVSGLFQRRGNSLRTFIKILDLDTKQTAGPILEFVSEQSERFFTVNAEVAKKILKAIGEGKFDAKFMGQYLRELPSFEAFRYYVKGMEKSTSYKEVDLGVAKVWFEKATTLSYDFHKAYEEKARTLFMIALIHKQMGRDASLLLQEAEEALRLAHFTVGIPSKKKQGETAARRSTLRWWEENFAFANGVVLANTDKTSEAINALKKAVQLVPEDGLAHAYLAKNGGDTSEISLAKKLNPCVP